ncbi:MAG: hypothetical protein NTW87_33235, partial [Planctomycetota bacterium]|nr:hypothetical protein [Planctomycetota bacterium]
MSMCCDTLRALVLCFTAAATFAAVGEDTELRIGLRRPAGPQEIGPAEFQAVIRQLVPPAPRQPPAQPGVAVP